MFDFHGVQLDLFILPAITLTVNLPWMIQWVVAVDKERFSKIEGAYNNLGYI